MTDSTVTSVPMDPEFYREEIDEIYEKFPPSDNIVKIIISEGRPLALVISGGLLIYQKNLHFQEPDWCEHGIDLNYERCGRCEKWDL